MSAKDDDLFFDSATAVKDGFVVKYSPPIGDAKFAAIYLTFENSTQEPDSLLKNEAIYWLERYNVPLMCFAENIDGDPLYCKGSGSNPLLAWISQEDRKVAFSFDSSQFDTVCQNLPVRDWKLVFSDIPYRTRAEVKEKVDRDWRRRGLLYRLIKTHWFFKASVIPIGYIIFEFFGPEWVSLLAMSYAIWRSITDGYRVWKPKPKTKKQLELDETQRRKEHYFYHCELNPEGFNKLRTENFGKSIREDNQAKILELKRKHNTTKSV